MKKLLIILAVITWHTGKAAFTGAELKVTGVTCSMCSNSVLRALQTLDFVEQVDVDLERTVFKLTFKPGKDVNPDKIRSKVEGAGFSVGMLQMDFRFDRLAVSNDFHYGYGGNTYHFVDVKSRTLTDVVTLTFVDKGFTSQKLHRKYTRLTAHSCIKTGRKAHCCTVTDNDRIYHVTI